ncbi:hypothetical protein MTR67_040180 [Solanum verrucosum]|uniref:Uncharacterized protein n=1 Tax=Solanum verrucosum TaxID=315347 RepID=A0AAF0UI57_SOLVR|nr:hypothetical protein MTR67_040180 [Solanum verrucosum]
MVLPEFASITSYYFKEARFPPQGRNESLPPFLHHQLEHSLRRSQGYQQDKPNNAATSSFLTQTPSGQGDKTLMQGSTWSLSTSLGGPICRRTKSKGRVGIQQVRFEILVVGFLSLIIPPRRSYVKRNMSEEQQAPPALIDPLAGHITHPEFRVVFQVLAQTMTA